MNGLNVIFEKYNEGYAALLVTGRSLHDLAVDPSDSKLRTLLEILRRQCREQHGMVLLRYSMAGGLDWDRERISDEGDRRTIEQALQHHGLLNIPLNQYEPSRVIRGTYSLARTPTEGLHWSDGQQLRFCVLFEFSEHLTPGQLGNGTQTESQIVAIELAHLLGHNLALRTSGNLMVFHGRDGLIDELVGSALHHVRLRQPELEEKRKFVATAFAVYTDATFEDGLDNEAVARLTMNTPNLGLENRMRASHRTGRPITAKELAEQKNNDVIQVSESTLKVLGNGRAKDIELCGENIERPKAFLERFAEGLLQGARSIPLNILLVGPPGTGKTELAIVTADRAKAAAYELLNPKDGIVGGTERKSRLQWTALNEWGGIAFCDEITEALPLERSEFDGDSGASKAVTAALLTELSNEGARGTRLLIGTTNCPWRMAAAMRSRFTRIPILHPLLSDFPQIIVAIARRIVPDAKIDVGDPKIQEAARMFYEKGANPREIAEMLRNTNFLSGSFGPETILAAADDMCPSADLPSAIYSDLWAVRTCTDLKFLPWYNNPSYTFPPHLQGVVDANGKLIDEELTRRLEAYKPHANV